MSKNFENIDLITYIYQFLKVQLTFKQRGFGYTRISFSINIVGVSTKTCILCRYVVRILSRDFATNQTTSKGRLKKKKKRKSPLLKDDRADYVYIIGVVKSVMFRHNMNIILNMYMCTYFLFLICRQLSFLQFMLL